MRSLFAIVLVMLLAGPVVARDAKGEEFFEKQIRPLLAQHCLKCHGDSKPKAKLRLTSRKALLTGGESGPVVVPGQPDRSLLIQAVRYLDTTRMPPSGKLPQRDVDLLVQWVKAGAPWPETEQKTTSDKPFVITDEQRKFWSFQPVKVVEPPAVRDNDRVRNAIDRFILARLEAKKLRPAAFADRRTLIRRATFDLIGLPPTPDEVEAFVNDRSADAYERLVDRLLSSPAYGERWGRHWLDLVRYTDSFDARGLGGEMDCADAFRYRDWVVQALNADLGYDRFLTDQLAGDVVPGDGFNRDGIIATGMLAIGNWGGGDADKEKLLTDVADDQVDVVTRTFLGLTVSCARCHDHKFDPISTKDYYALAGIFFSSHILPNVGPKTNGPPMLRIPLAPPSELARRARHSSEMAAVAKQLEAARQEAITDHVKRMLSQTPRYLLAAFDVMNPPKDKPAPTAEDVAKRDKLHLPTLLNWLRALRQDDLRPLAKTISDVAGRQGIFSYRNEADCPNVVVNTTNQTQKFSTLTLPPRSASLHPGPASGVVASWSSPVATTVKISGKISDADAVCGDGVEWRLSSTKGELARGSIANGASQELPAKSLEKVSVSVGERIDLVILPKREYTCDTTTVQLSIRQTDGKGEWDLARDVVADPLRKKASVWSFADTKTLTAVTIDLSDWRAAVAKVNEGKAERESLKKAAEDVPRRFSKIDANNPFWLTRPEDEAILPQRQRESLAKLRTELEAKRKVTFAPLEYANGTQEGGVPGSPHAGVHDVRVHLRGRYDRLGDVVPRRFPEILAGSKQTPITKGSGRLQLAKWLTDEKHPLTARVMVNRLWQFHFGRGLVNTSSNFGYQGEKPSHPELLDWLASEFVRSGWSIKALHRLMMLSATYQQDSIGDDDGTRSDPDNLLLSRMPRRRLEAEAIRDGLLFVAGNLDRTMSGKAVRDLEEPRRTLYLMTVRSDRSGFGPLFDVADSTAPVEKRTVSTVAPQALFLLNNPFSQKQAESLTKRVMASAKEDRGRIDFAYRLLYGRPPLSEEVTLGVGYVERAGGKEQAWRDYCQVLLCANEFAYVE